MKKNILEIALGRERWLDWKKEWDWCRKKIVVTGISVWILSVLFGQSVVSGLVLGIGSAIGALGVLVWWKQEQSRRKEEAIEAELPIVLLRLSIELRLHRSFEVALKSAAQKGGMCGSAIQQVLQESEKKGASIPEALQHWTMRLHSEEAKRAVVQLIYAYEQGTRKTRAIGVRRMATQLLEKQRIQARAFTGKVTLWSLVFIVVSAIVPALFQSFILVGSGFLEWSFEPWQVLVLSGGGFLFLDAVILAWIRFQTPLFLR